MSKLRTNREILVDERLQKVLEDVERHFNNDPRGLGTIRFYERIVGEAGRSLVVPIEHGLPFVPTDAWLTSVILHEEGTQMPTFKPEDFTSKHLFVSVNGVVTLRFYAGVLKISKGLSSLSQISPEPSIAVREEVPIGIPGTTLPDPTPTFAPSFQGSQLRFTNGEVVFYSKGVLKWSPVGLDVEYSTVPRLVEDVITGLVSLEDIGILGRPIPSEPPRERKIDRITGINRRTRQGTPWERFFIRRVDDSEGASKRTSLSLMGLVRSTAQWEEIRRISLPGVVSGHAYANISHLYSIGAYLYGIYTESSLIYGDEFLHKIYRFRETDELAFFSGTDSTLVSRLEADGFSVGGKSSSGVVTGASYGILADGSLRYISSLSDSSIGLNLFARENYSYGYWGNDYCLFFADPLTGIFRVWTIAEAGTLTLVVDKVLVIPNVRYGGLKSRGFVYIFSDDLLAVSFMPSPDGFRNNYKAYNKEGEELSSFYSFDFPSFFEETLSESGQNDKTYLTIFSGYIRALSY